jgi:hypothetical protein
MLNYLEGRGLKLDVREWFDHSMPKPRVAATWVRRLLDNRKMEDNPQAERRFVWLGGQPISETVGSRTRLTLTGRTSKHVVTLAERQAQWLDDLIRHSALHNNPSNARPLLREIRTTFPGTARELEIFLNSSPWKKVRSAGLLLV